MVFLLFKSYSIGKQKKVFQIFHILQYFENISIHDSVIDNIYGDHLKSCYEEYIALGGQTNEDYIVNQMKSLSDIDTWMSGLICSQNECCVKQFNDIVPDNPTEMKKVNEESISSSSEPVKRGLNWAMKRNGIKSKGLGKDDCPPDCGCDNPWAFLSTSSIKK